MIVDCIEPIAFLQGTRDKAVEIERLAKNGRIVDATRVAKQLHRDGITMIIQELKCAPLCPDDQSVLTIANSLSDVLVMRGIQGNTKLMKITSKAYRLFVELCLYQTWRISAVNKHERVLIFPDLRNDLIDTTKKLKMLFTQRECGKEILFDLRCARQAAKQLEPSEALWKKYMNHVIELILIGGSSGISGSIELIAIWEALNRLATDVLRDNPMAQYTWFPKVHVMSWYSHRVSNMGDFDTKVTENVELCKRRGGNYSLCLATIFMRLIKNSDVGVDIKTKAFKGDGNRQEGLIHMISWKPGDVPTGIFRTGVEKIKSAFDRIVQIEDPHWETRNLASYFLMRLATKSKYAAYKDESFEALSRRRKELEEAKTSRRSIIAEKSLLQTRLELAKSRRAKIEAELIQIGAEQVHIQATRSARDTASYQNEEDKIVCLGLKEDSLHCELKQVIDVASAFEPVLEDSFVEDSVPLSAILDEEEEQRIEKILGKISSLSERVDGVESPVDPSLNLSRFSGSNSSSSSSSSSTSSSSSDYIE